MLILERSVLHLHLHMTALAFAFTFDLYFALYPSVKIVWKTVYSDKLWHVSANNQQASKSKLWRPVGQVAFLRFCNLAATKRRRGARHAYWYAKLLHVGGMPTSDISSTKPGVGVLLAASKR